MSGNETSVIERSALRESLKYEETSKSNDEVKKEDSLFLYFSVITAILLMLVSSATSVWTSPALIKLQSNDTNINVLGRPITTVETSFLLGVPGMIALIGSSLLPKVADVLGRKRSLQLMGLGIFLSIMGLAFSGGINLIIVFSSCIQIFCAGAFGILPIYITEICEDHNRAKFGCLMTVFSPIGQLYTLVIGPVFSLRYFTLLMALPLIPFSICFFFVPESPVYSLTKNRDEECLHTLKKLRNRKSNKEIEHDFIQISKSLMATDEAKFSLFRLFSVKEGRVGLLLALIPILVQNFCGIQTITPLLGPIFNDSGSNFSGDTIAIMVGTVKLITFIIITFIIEKTGRKLMLMVSATGSGISASLLGLFFYLKYINSPIVDKFEWGPLICILVYIFAYSLGLGPIPVAIVGELFSSDLRSTAVGIIFTLSSLLVTTYTSVYPLLAEMIGTHWCMWIFGISCFLGTFFIYTMLPDTRGKSIIEIQEMLKKYKYL